MEVKIIGVANMSAATAEFAKITAQVEALNASMAKSTIIANGINPKGYERLTKAMDAGSKTYRNSLASTGAFRVEQLRLNDATERYTDLLQRQRLSFRDMRKNKGIMKAAYAEQLRMQEMIVRQSSGIGNGKNMYDVATPKYISKDLDTFGRKLVWTGAQLKSAGTQMVNFGKNTQWAGRQLAMGFTMPMVALGVATGVMAYKVDKELTRIAKVYDTTTKVINGDIESEIAAQTELAQVRVDAMRTAEKAARDYGASMTDTLSVQADLAATGKQGAALQESTNEVMRIATLGEFDHATALKTVISLQSILKSSTKETADQLNYMNSIENATSLATEDFAKAIPIALGPLKEMGGGLQDLSMLLVSMKERGIEAGEGANAIKAMMQRLYRPSKQIREEWEAITNTNITEIRDRNKGNVMGMLEDIEQATAELNRPEKVQAIGGLIGTYQVARINAVLGGFKDIREGVGQTQAVLKTNEEGWEEWSATAEREIEAIQQSASGKFKAAIETLKIQAAELGKPFLEVGATIVSGIVKIFKAFNELPGFIKKMLAGFAIFMAVTGPLLMLVGLFANLGGNVVRLIGGIMGLGKAFVITTKEARAQELSMMGVIKQTFTAVPQYKLMAQQLGLLSQANQAATRTTLAHLSALRSRNSALITIPGGAGIGGVAPSGQNRNLGSKTITVSGLPPSAASYRQPTTNDMQQTSRFAGAAAAGTAAAAVSMGVLMMSSNETAKKYAMIALTASMIVPALAAMVKPTKQFAKGVADGAKSMWAAVTAQGAFSAGLKRTMGVLAATMMPLAGIVALTAAAGVLYKIWKDGNERRKEAIEDQKTLNGLSREYASFMGMTWNDYRTPKYNTIEEQGEEVVTDTQKSNDYFNNEEAGTKAVEAYNRIDSSAKKANVTLRMFTESQVNLGMNAQQAASRVRGFMLATGASMEDADGRAQELLNTLGKLNSSSDWAAIMQAERDKMIDEAFNIREDRSFRFDLEHDPEQAERWAKDNAQRVVGYFNEALVNAEGNYSEVTKAVSEFNATAMAGWNQSWNQYVGESGVAFDSLKEQGIHDAEQLAAAFEKMTPDERFDFVDDLGLGASDAQAMLRALESANSLSTELYKQRGIAAGYGDDWRTIGDAVEDVNLKIAQMSIMQQNQHVNKLKTGFDNIKGVASSLPFDIGDIANETLLAEMNAINLARGYKTGSNFAQALMYFTNQTKTAAAKTAAEVAGLSNNLLTAGGRAQAIANTLGHLARTNMGDFSNMMKDVMTGVQQQMADDWSEAQNAQMDAEMESVRSTWDRHVEGVNSDIERQQKGLDAKWEKRKAGAEKYWDARIDSVQNAIDAEQKAEEKRQKMFDAEIARIKQLNDMANANIDFNVALNSGDLDEAARITNNAKAASDEMLMNNAQEAMAERSAARVEKLEKKSERLENQRDRAMKAMDKREKAEKEHLDRISKARQKAAEADRDKAIKAKEAEIKLRKEVLDEEVSMLMAGTARNEKELKARLKAAGIGYDEFRATVIKEKGKEWGDYFGDMLSKGITKAGDALLSDNMWAELGEGSMREMAKAMGFANFRSMKHFMKTGEWVDLPDPLTHTQKSNATGDISSARRGRQERAGTYHTGGKIGSDKGSRKGVARTMGGLHSSETLINAQKGEFVVNKDATAKHEDTIRAINDGTFHPGSDIMGGAGFMGQGPAAAMAAMLARRMSEAVAARMGTAIIDKQNQMAAASSGSYWTGAIGNYNIPGIKPWVLEAANYLGGKFGVANIGGLGERPGPSDHPRGLALDFMIGSDISKGDAIAAEALRLQNVLDATYMIWNKRIHSFDSRGWQPYRHYSGQSNPTLDHVDHVHISFAENGKVGDLPKTTGSAGSAGSFVAGPGGRHHPTGRVGTQGSRVHGSPAAIDISLPVGNKIYAAGDGRVTSSHDITGHESRAEHGGLGYRSYGRVITIAHDNGGSSLYAHLSERFAQTGQRVTGGSVIGLSGNTGYSTGPHLHFGGSPSPFAYLKKGAANVNFDNVPAILHKNEAVLTEDLNRKFHQGVENFANGGNNEYNIKVEINGANKDVSQLAKEVVKVIRREESRLPQKRTAR